MTFRQRLEGGMEQARQVKSIPNWGTASTAPLRREWAGVQSWQGG